MEKAGLLITRLLELYNNKAGNEQLRITAQLLLSELEKIENKEQELKSVAVFFPASHITADNISEEPISPEPKQEIKPQQPTKIAEKPAQVPPQTRGDENTHGYYNPLFEIPTLALKQQEINEAMAQQESINDKLKHTASNKEVGYNVSEGPIKDLRKGIGINDQCLFINELFRGDQTMYDRSIKTINSFNIYGEAELWIKRELKLKLGWNENSKASILFDQLVRRRFS